jgi:cob(I)alamin adenosyltransferase
VDELNSVLGALAASLPTEKQDLLDELERIQSDLLHTGAWLATAPRSPLLRELKQVDERSINFLEKAIDRMGKELPTLRCFILPGGHASAAWSHVARTVCRRAERHVVALSADRDETETPERLRMVMIYLNRLSDYLFMFALYCNALFGVPEIPWKK